VFVSGPAPLHISYPRFKAALGARDLAFIRRNARSIAIGLPDAAEVCRLIAEQDPGRLEEASVHWIKRYAAEAPGQRRSDYLVIVSAFDSLTVDPERAAGELAALCAARGIGS
jgi:hypothetical protein